MRQATLGGVGICQCCARKMQPIEREVADMIGMQVSGETGRDVLCGISSAVKFACEPDPKSMMNLSPLPSSISQEQLACARRTNGLLVPSAMARILLAASGSVFGK